MSKKGLFFAVTLLLAVPAFVYAVKKDAADIAVEGAVREGQDVIQAVVGLADEASEFIEAAGDALVETTDEQIGRLKRWSSRAKVRAKRTWMRLRHPKSWKQRLEGATDIACYPGDCLADTSPADVADGVWNFRISNLTGHTKAASLCLNVVLAVALYKAYHSEPVKKFRSKLNRMVRGSAKPEAEKKTAEPAAPAA